MASMPSLEPQPSEDEVLLEALLNTASYLGLRKRELADIIHMDERTLRRKSGLTPDSAPGQLALLLVRAYRAAFVLMGGAEGARHWFDTPNRSLNGSPRELVAQIEGLVRVVNYLDAMRGKV
ncbi:MbcA/ParS/Xre antitoxin family protein [Microbulbifer sediminum]|uniref:MbcA/ParS/Xre antitoxin family protein n=1 Tax=Microbulbifer sediminum TaxID=2904250 RepID=UPI001F1BAA8A|nr:MbcA/ParS/Xre antitoxin family protein [Microbulbifer sediminum]